jgi:hypothetical protein
LQGWSVSSSSTSVSYTSAETAFKAGYTYIYGVYKKSGSTSSAGTYYYYRGNSTQNSVTKSQVTADAYYYGKGSYTGGGTTYSYGSVTTSCAVTGENWEHIGFASSQSTQSSSSSATTLFDAGYTTIYGTYKKGESMTYYPQNGDGASSVSVTNYRYGTGQVTSNIPSEPKISNNNLSLLGWASSSESTDPVTWASLWNGGTRTVYAIWETIIENLGNVYVGVNNEWKKAKVFFGLNNVWQDGTTKIGANNDWK